MTTQEKTLARILFKNKIYESDGQKFEDVFSAIMRYVEPDFQSIKPWGNIGDRKNDGYIKNKGIFYQVFAPENIKKSYPDVIKKIENDFSGLINQWSPVNNFYFVINDKYNGVHPDSEQLLEQIKIKNNLTETRFLTPKDLENMLFKLDDDQILTITGYLPDPINLITLNYSIINEIVEYISAKPLGTLIENVIIPEWSEKIIFNGLDGGVEETYLNNGFLQVAYLDEYLHDNSEFLANELKNDIRATYLNLSQKFQGKKLFWKIVNDLLPNKASIYQAHIIVIMSKYFETCDIYEEPK